MRRTMSKVIAPHPGEFLAAFLPRFPSGLIIERQVARDKPMRQWIVRPHHTEPLAQVEAVQRDLRFGEVRIRMHAASLNFRDQLLLAGRYPTSRDEPVVPLSDGAGEAIALGQG